MQFEKSYHSTFTVVGIACRASNAQPKATQELWSRFHTKIFSSHLLERVSDAVYAIYCEYDSDYTGEYTFVLGYEVPFNSLITEEPPEGMVVAVIPGGKYAVLDARGKMPETLFAAWEKVWASTLTRTYVCDFEIHWGPVAVEVHVGIE